jgi:hypothetical protein
MHNRISLFELVASGIRLRPAEAVAIVGEICRQRAARILPGLPSLGVIRLTCHGEIAIEGPVPTGEDSVSRAAQLLESLLAGLDAPPEYRASGALRLLIARALGTLDLPPFASLEEFCAALVRFSTLDARDTVAMLVAAYLAAQAEAASHAEVEAAELAPEEPVATPLVVAAAAPSPWRRRGEFAVWIAAPACAAVLGYVLALPPSEPEVVPAQPTTVGRDIALPVHAPKAKPSDEATPSNHDAPVEPHVVAAAPTNSAPAVSALDTLGNDAPRVLQASAFSPAFAPSGAVYFHQQRDGASALKRVDVVDDGSLRKITSIVDDRARNFHPRPSPDGTRIAFDSDRDGTRGVYVANADGRHVQRISGEGYAAVPSWSPDGEQLVFVRAEAAAPRVWNLWLANADGSNLRRLTHHRVGQAWGGSWFPDGRRIAYSVESDLILLDITSGDSRVLSSPRPGMLVRTPAVSPDGTRIVFQVHHDGTWIADARTGAMHRVLADPTAEEFTWAPDGRHVAFHSHRTGSWSVWVMPI